MVILPLKWLPQLDEVLIAGTVKFNALVIAIASGFISLYVVATHGCTTNYRNIPNTILSTTPVAVLLAMPMHHLFTIFCHSYIATDTSAPLLVDQQLLLLCFYSNTKWHSLFVSFLHSCWSKALVVVLLLATVTSFASVSVIHTKLLKFSFHNTC